MTSCRSRFTDPKAPYVFTIEKVLKLVFIRWDGLSKFITTGTLKKLIKRIRQTCKLCRKGEGVNADRFLDIFGMEESMEAPLAAL
mmetsp:Transcript_20348/g.39984  ORF Transcript_20348/g.39984 Transcript_20348/m.39984 type:complete len:85 (-) Transcript_20348:1155-1409(-)